MSEILAAAAAALGLPESLVQRSAEARAAETGASADEILAAWAGGAPIDAPLTPPAPSPEPADGAEPAGAGPSAPIVEQAAPPQPVLVPTGGRAPIPSEVTAAEAAHLPEVITVPTAGIRERTDFAMPKWLTSVLIVIPLFALFALGGSATEQCGEATELRMDVVTGEIVNCDGSEFTGQEIGVGGVDFIAVGEEIYGGAEVAGVNCAGCHGAGGQGAANFPALTGVLTTFGSCTDHVEWVTLGSVGFAGGTYGDTAKTVAGGMPSFGSALSAEQIAAVAAFERVRFGGGDPDSVLADCGLADEEPSGESTTEGDSAPEASSSLSG